MANQLIFLLLLVLTCCTLCLGVSCKDDGLKTISVSITSRRNLTGHQIIQMQMLHSPGFDTKKEIVPLKMDIEQGEKNCGGEPSKYLSVTIAAQTVVGDDYEFYPLVGRYKLHTTELAWNEAFNICQQEGTHLVVINSELEAQMLNEMLKAKEKLVTLVGITDIVTEGKIVSIFGDDLSVTGFEKWFTNEPTNSGGSDTNPGEDCVVFIRDSALFNDVPCTNKYSFICEQELY